jgi:tRNA dimethylallyltransferase
MDKTLYLIVGPTASGKTNLAIKVAQAFSTEIISADARQFYKGMDIGTAKPTVEELSLVKHHFIDNREAQAYYSAGDFERDALKVIYQIFEHHNFVVAVGGSGLYIKALCEGMDEMPPVDLDYRNELITQFEKQGIEWLQQALLQLDPIKFQQVDTNNPQRIMRALEICKQGVVLAKPKMPRSFNIIKFAIAWDRDLLYHRINQRVELMMELGLLKEVESLLPLKNCNALKTVGYSELFDYFEGSISLTRAVELIKQHSRNYAKRQLTWFKADPSIVWISPQEAETLAQNLVQTEKK